MCRAFETMFSESPPTPGRRQQMPVDSHPGGAGRVQLLDQAPVYEPVHLREDPRRTPGPGVVDFAPNALDEPVAEAAGSDQEIVEVVRVRVAGEEIEELGAPRLFVDLLLAAEEDALDGQERLDVVEEAAVLRNHQLVDALGHRGQG